VRPLKTDLSIFKKFSFERVPVGVRYLLKKPEGIAQLDKVLPLCEMVKEAQERTEPFYISKHNEDCAGKMVLGMEQDVGFSGGGEIGVRLEIFEDARANRRLYQYQPNFGKNVCNYVAFSPFYKLTFEPNLVIILASVSQAEIILRAMSYSTGEKWSSNLTGVGACSWIFAYPYVTGKVNYAITGLSFGMKARQVFPEGQVLMSIPFDWLHIITRNLEEMKWVLPSYADGPEKFLERDARIKAELIK
jgi:uncharacterized protein (DUF169 family)